MQNNPVNYVDPTGFCPSYPPDDAAVCRMLAAQAAAQAQGQSQARAKVAAQREAQARAVHLAKAQATQAQAQATALAGADAASKRAAMAEAARHAELAQRMAMAQGVAQAQAGTGYTGPALSPLQGYPGPEVRPGTPPSQYHSPASDEGKIASILFGASAFGGALGSGSAVTQYSSVQGGRWFDFATGQWYRFGYYGNQWRSAESVAASKLGALRIAGAARTAGRLAFVVGAGLSVFEAGEALAAGNTSGAGGAVLDIGVGYVGMVGGVPGAVFAGAYFVLDVSGLLGFSFGPSSALAPAGAEGAPSYSTGAGGTLGY